MRTTINIRDDLMARFDPHKGEDQNQTIELSIREYIENLEDLSPLSGKINIDPDWQRKKFELNEYRNHRFVCA